MNIGIKKMFGRSLKNILLKKEFRENNMSVYSLSTKNKWLNDICSHND
jgi:hypothetical protein